MGDEKKAFLPSDSNDAFTQINFPEDPRKKNIAGYGYLPGVTKSAEDYEVALNQFQKDLEQRYTTPNWGKISQAFGAFHPGGAFEALGQVGGVLGEQLEEAKKLKPGISQMKAQLAAYKYGIEQQKEAQRLFEENPGDPSPENAARMAWYTGEGSPLEKGRAQLNFYIDRLLKDWETGINMIDFYKSYPKPVVDEFFKLVGNRPRVGPPVSDGSSGAGLTGGNPPPPQNVVKPPPAANAGDGAESQSDSVGIPGVPLEKFYNQTKGLPADIQLKEVAAQSALAREATDKNQNALSKQSIQYKDVLKDTANAYKAVANPKINHLFAIGQGPKVADLILKAASGYSISAPLAEMLKQTEYKSKEERGEIENALMLTGKAIGTYLVANSFSNPTNERTNIEQFIPNMREANQETLLKGLALMGSDAKQQVDMYPAFTRFINTKGNDGRYWAGSEEIARVQKEAAERKRMIAANSILQKDKSGNISFWSPDESMWSVESGSSDRPNDSAREKGASSGQAERTNRVGSLRKVKGKWVRE